MAGEIAERNSLLIRPVVSAHRLAGRRRFRRSGTIAHRFPSVLQRQAFTLIELLVVISIMTLLMAILLPTLQRVRNQARAVVCQSNLRQWGVIFSMYVNDNGGKMHDQALEAFKFLFNNGSLYRNDLLFCPMAARGEYRADNNLSKMIDPWFWPPSEFIFGNKSTAWCYRYISQFPALNVTTLSGSYGWNLHMICQLEHSIDRYPGWVRNNLPVFLDCISICGRARPSDEPPEYEGHFKSPLSLGSMMNDITYFSIDRHSGGINSLFLDWSVRKVGVKELWTLKWENGFDTAGPWTRAGGVLPEDWPQWMRSFKDY